VGQEIVRQLGELDSTLKPISVNDVKLRAERPQFAALDNGKLARAGYTMPSWQDAIGRYLSAS
jgi:dTDP-4-dehydrorhamnose reductase